MKKNNKKGFTIVELVIVVAVIAILAGVLIPTFSGVVKKARLSADQQAIRQMNTSLAVTAATDDMTIFDLYDILAEANMDAQDYKALTKGADFYWDKEINRILMVENGKAIYPEEYKGREYSVGNWYSLTQKIAKENVVIANDGKATTDTAGKVIDALEKTITTNRVSMDITDKDIDMMGAAMTIDNLKNGSEVTIENGTIMNATAVEAQTTGNGTEGHDGIYNMAMVAKVEKGATLHLKNLVIDNMNLRDTNAGNCAFLVGQLDGTLILENVTIKNSSIIGYTSVGALVGYMNASANVEIRGTLTLENVSVQAVGGRVGQLFGYMPLSMDRITADSDAKIVMKNVTSGMYACAQNTGACVVDGCTHGALGLHNDGEIHSWQVEGSGELGCDKKANRVLHTNSFFGYAAAKRDGATVDVTADYNAVLAGKVSIQIG